VRVDIRAKSGDPGISVFRITLRNLKLGVKVRLVEEVETKEAFFCSI
jgi:hypothetical protein